MKFNLKNRPRHGTHVESYFVEQCLRWFEGFEKELQELFDPECFEEGIQPLIKFLRKEILGE